MNSLKTVLKFEYMTYLKNKVFLGMTIAFMVIIIGVGNIPNIINLYESVFKTEDTKDATDDKIKTIMVNDSTGLYSDDILKSYLPNYAFEKFDLADKEAVYAKVEAGDAEMALEIVGLDYKITMDGSKLMFARFNEVEKMIKTINQDNILLDKGLTMDEIKAVSEITPNLTMNAIGKDLTQSYFIGYFLLMIMYISVLLYGTFVMTSVVTEKTSKAMEVLITSVKPKYLMFGKVLGVGLAGLTQIGALLITLFVTLLLNKNTITEFSPEIGAILNISASTSLFAYAGLFFLLGFFTYAFLYAAFASTVSRMEDSQTVSMVPMGLFVLAFLIAQVGMTNPSLGYVKAFSFIPFFSPMVMFMRICVAEVPVLHIIAAIAINFATIILVGIGSAKIYRAGVMMYGKPPSIITTIKYMFAKE